MNFAKWNDYWDQKTNVTTERGTFNVYSTVGDTDFYILCAHGAGHSALSFSLLAQCLKPSFNVIAPDFKCHGDTPGDPSKDLGIEDLTADYVSIGQKLIPKGKKVILLGHSMGGTVATFASSSIPALSLIAIDTIEGTSIDQMPNMKKLLLDRPQKFSSEEDAIMYVATSGEMENINSAVISVSGRMKKLPDGSLTWRTDLIPSEPFWAGWFKGFADAYIKSKPYKVLVLPNIDRLDTPFTIGHMSGKFQLSVILHTNHCVHEDEPEKVADVIVKLVRRIGNSPNWK